MRCIALSSIALAAAAHAQSTVTLLHPTGAGQSSALGVSADQQVGFTFTLADYAALWSGSPASCINLNPANASESHAYAAQSGKQVGDAFISNQRRASLWTGTAASWVDLSPAGTFRSIATSTSGNQQSGVARVGLFDHAGFWLGTAASWTDLHPAAATTSIAFDTNGSTQVGNATIDNVLHACLWNSTPASFTDLHPAVVGVTGSSALSISGSAVAGYAAGISGHAAHACLWANGTAGSFVDLNPANSTESQALDNGSSVQVGYIRIASGPHIASLWRNTAASWEDLSLSLPGNWSDTQAEKVFAPSPFKLLIAGHGFNVTNNRREAILWNYCYANCDGSTTLPLLTANDFQCFINKAAAGAPYANCDGSTGTPFLTANDFQCFLNAFAMGCP